jgi:hypothetical protein
MFNLVAMVDGVLISAMEDRPGRAHALEELRVRKKLLSRQLVQGMERIDALLAVYFQQER